jgi:hypothetical protein
MARIKHPAWGYTREVPDNDLGRWVAAGWVKADSGNDEDKDTAVDTAVDTDKAGKTARK